MKNTQKQEIFELSTFDNSISLWQMIPSGRGKGLALLKAIVDSILNNNNSRIPSIIITGEEGKRTHSRAFIRALGIDNIAEIDASLLQPSSDLAQFFNSDKNTAHLIINAENLWAAVQSVVIQICKKNKFQHYNYQKSQIDVFEVPGPMILTAEDIDKVPAPISDAVDFVIEIEKYTPEQLELVVLQRLKYAHIDYECETVLGEIVEQGNGVLRDVIKFLKICIVVMRSDERDLLKLEDIDKAGRIM